jgi:hypothetical protein
MTMTVSGALVPFTETPMVIVPMPQVSVIAKPVTDVTGCGNP